MKVPLMDRGKRMFKVQPEDQEDLWVLSQFIEEGDLVRARTERKISLGEKDQKRRMSRERMTLTLEVERIEFGTQLRIIGKISDGPETAPRGSYHTFTVEPRDTLSITKQEYSAYHDQILKESRRKKQAPLLLVVHDREQAQIAEVQRNQVDILTSLSGDVEKKQYQTKGEDFFGDLVTVIEQYAQRLNPRHIILASPAFWKEELYKRLPKGLQEIAVKATCSSVGRNAVQEVLKRPELKQVLQEERMAREVQAVEQFFAALGQEGPVAYGENNVETAVEAGAVDTLLLSQAYIQQQQEDGTFNQVNTLMKKVKKMQGDVMIISSEHEGGERLDGLGGIAALLRYRIN